MGLATITTAVKTLDEPVAFRDRWFTEGSELPIHGLAPLREGVVLRDLVPDLQVF